MSRAAGGQEQLWAALAAAARGTQAGPVVLRLPVAPGPPGAAAAACVRQWAERHACPLVELSGDIGAPTAFGPLRGLLRRVLRFAERGNGVVLADLAPELAVLLPGWRPSGWSCPAPFPAWRRAGSGKVPSLAQIALGGTKRRLNRDSERLYRLVSATATVTAAGLAGLAAAARRPAVILVEAADLCDRYTLACLRQLCMATEGPGPVIVLITGDDEAHRPRWVAAAPAGSPGQPGWADAEREQSRVLGRLLAATGAVDLACWTGDGRAADARPPDLARLPDPARRWLVAAVVLGDPRLASILRGDQEDGLAAAARTEAVRAEVLAGLTPSGYREECAELGRELRARPVRSEGTEAVLAHLEVAAGERDAGVDRALRLTQRSYGFTLNFELMLVSCRICVAGQASGAERAATLMFAGLTHAYLGHHEVSGAVFRDAYRVCTSPVAKAQICYYQGLIAGKRQQDLATGVQWFERGLAHIAGRRSPAALLESGWLRNGLAMVAWREGRYAHAERLVRAAIADTAGEHGAQLVNLRVNLINNLSVLQEAAGACDAALETWRSLAHWGEVIPGGTFAKAFLYRESWLLLRLDEIGPAYASAVASWQIARRYRDLFHLDVISRTCAYLACRQGDHEVALVWARANIELPRPACQRAGRAHAMAQEAHIRYQAGDQRGAVESMTAACRAAGPGAQEQRFTTALAALSRRLSPVVPPPGVSSGVPGPGVPHGPATGAAAPRTPGVLGPDDDLFGITLDRPRAKLSTPFPLAQLLPDPPGAALRPLPPGDSPS